MKIKYTVPILVLITIILVVFAEINYVENEGFNSTDEGVVLAQSWRIINGEQAHKDYVSIRPVGSGYLHTINFIIPGPLVVNARWFVLLQFFIIALVLSVFVVRELTKYYKKDISPLLFFSLLIVGFTVTVLNYNLYSWTTIDAVFWSVLALPFLLSESKYKITIAFVLLSFAALSRQTFVLGSVIAYIYIFIKFRKQFVGMLPVFFIGAIAFFLYLFMLIYNNVLGDFLSQMTGRTEFVQTTVSQFAKKFITNYSSPFVVLTFILSLFLYSKPNSKISFVFFEKNYPKKLALFFVLIALIHIIRHFVIGEIDIMQLPFGLFYLLFSLTAFHFVLFPQNNRMRIVAISVGVIAWLSAISLGDNSPIFASGPLFILLIGLAADICLNYESQFGKKLSNRFFLLIVALVFFVLGIYSQQRINYRDNASNTLVYGLNYASSEFGKINTNIYMLDYYCDLADVYRELPNAIDRTMVFPHNAMFYPVMKTQNPMSLDWLTPNECIGQEKRVEEDFYKMISDEKVFFIIDKIDTRIIKDGIVSRTYENDLIYELIISNSRKLSTKSDYFSIYISN